MRNYYAGQVGLFGSREQKCEACGKPVKGPEVYGSGRFCSELCAKLRTPEKHFSWLIEHPDEYKKWQEEQKKKPDNDVFRNLPL